jgi:hypothetical protein
MVGMPPTLSKSRFLAGLQCPKRLWYEVHEPRAEALAASTQVTLDQGLEIGRLARGLTPGGFAVEAGFQEAALALKQTREAMAQGHKVLYEAAAEASGAFVRADILLRVKPGQDLWDLFEVKSSGFREEAEVAEEKEQFLWDLALQRYAFERSKHGIRKACLVLVNKDFVRHGPVDPKLFFKVEDVSQEVAKRLPQIPALLQDLLLSVAHPQAPKRDIGQHCREPHPCPFQDKCWPAAGPTHIFNLRGLGWAKKFEHFHHGRERIIDYLADQLTPWQAKQVQALSQGQPVIERAALQGFLNGLTYPLYHLDFETINPALPPFDGCRPFEQCVFQYSLHVQAGPGAEPQHFEFLPGHTGDPRPQLIAKLLDELGSSGTVLAYNMVFERGRLNDLAGLFPKHRARIDAVIERMQDLMLPFAKGWYVHPQFEGSVSIKSVLPALVPGMSYDGMAVADGGGAQRAYGEFLDPRTRVERRQELRGQLLEYCGQDTLAMVKVLGALGRNKP